MQVPLLLSSCSGGSWASSPAAAAGAATPAAPTLPACPCRCAAANAPALLPAPLVAARHLDADEATVLGAGLFGANLSSIFRLRQFGMADKTPYSIAIQLESEAGGCQTRLWSAPPGLRESWQGWQGAGQAEAVVPKQERWCTSGQGRTPSSSSPPGSGGAGPAAQQHPTHCSHLTPTRAAPSAAAPKTLVPAMKKMPTKRGVHLHNLTDDSLAFTLAFDNAPGGCPSPVGLSCKRFGWRHTAEACTGQGPQLP